VRLHKGMRSGHKAAGTLDTINWEYLLHVSTFATTRVALPTGVEPG
jgi:hypothetical protein